MQDPTQSVLILHGHRVENEPTMTVITNIFDKINCSGQENLQADVAYSGTDGLKKAGKNAIS
ncbi:hypothetical protein [Caproiciproducens sp.]|uniref:hypothetical protein n=1 Tax=Caproiciproducens sp. TaxID=1954376 RepID=UPI002897A06F|nr:hypothetical protein [Caproiciproducens sp.]